MDILKMSLMTLYSELENIFRQQVLDSYPSDWSEDYITRKIFFEYRKLFRDIEINGLSLLPIKINSAAYKLTGKAENKFGDIGFIVRITHPDPGRLDFEGVTSLEAKIIHKNKRKFQEIKGRQLNTISSNVKSPMLLLYDNQSIQKFHDYSFFPSTTKQNHAVVVPIDIVESIIRDKELDYTRQDKARNKLPIDANIIYKFSVPLAYQILFRYFRGLDLDFNQDLIQHLKGYESEYSHNMQERNLPQYLLLVSVSYGDSDSSIEFDINRNIFSEITSSEPDEIQF